MDTTGPTEDVLEDQELVAKELLTTESQEISKQKFLKPTLGKEYDFKEDSETSYMFECRRNIVERLKKLRTESGALTMQDIEVISRMINNKIWYNVEYDKESEDYIKYILSLI
jgi:hypothetical protein